MPSTDITKCTGIRCKLKKTCWRYLSPVGMRQSYFVKVPKKSSTKCDEYWEYKNETVQKN